MPSPAPFLHPQTVADLLETYRSAGGDPARFIIIGGSAGLQWSQVFAPAGSGGTDPARTRDVDFQFDSFDERDSDPFTTVQAFADAVGGRAIRPSMGHETPEFAQVIVPDWFGPDDPLYVDFLPDVLGLERADVAKHADILEAEASDGHTVEIRVAHPVHVLFGAVENYLRLPGRRNPETLARVDRLVPIVRAYIQHTAEASSEALDSAVARTLEKEALWSMQALLKRSATPAYARFTVGTDRDLLAAIPAQERTPVAESFWSKEFPQLCDRVERRRDVARKRSPEG